MPSIKVPAAKKATTLTVSLFICFCSCLFFFAQILKLSKCSIVQHMFNLLSVTFLLQVAVKCRPLSERERGRDIVRVIDNKVYGVFGIFCLLLVLNLEFLLY